MQNRPEYGGGSIVNLMGSIIRGLGGESQYEDLRIFPANNLVSARNVVLIWIDGLGYELLQKYGQKTTFYKYLRGKITSVFPTDTAPCSATFLTGEAPQQHAITGWNVYLRELGLVTTILPYKSRLGKMSLLEDGIDPNWIFEGKSVFEKIKCESYYLNPVGLKDSAISSVYARGSKLVIYQDEKEVFEKIGSVLNSNMNRKYVFAYLPELDKKCHIYSTQSEEVQCYLSELDQCFTKFINSNIPNGTTILVTADHGLIDQDDELILDLDQHPVLREALVIPGTGTGKVLYCFLKPAMESKFVKYVQENLVDYCDLVKSDDLVAQGYFGLLECNPKLKERIGDYVLIMKGKASVKDRLLGETAFVNRAVHGGLSDEELFVPLVVYEKS